MVKLKNPKTFAYTPKIGCIGETQLRLYTSYGQVNYFWNHKCGDQNPL